MSIVVSGIAVSVRCFTLLGANHYSGIVVPGLSDAPGAEHDPSNLCLLEATSGAGIACRPLLTVSVLHDFPSFLLNQN